MSVLFVGEILVDLICRGVTPQAFLGGAPANAAIHCCRHGVQSSLLGSVGDDLFGAMLLDKLRTEGVNCKFIGRSSRPTSLAAIYLAEDPYLADIRLYREADTDISLESVSSALAMGPSVVCFGSLTLTCSRLREIVSLVLDRADTYGYKVVFDINFREHAWDQGQKARDIVREVCARSHIVKGNSAEIKWLHESGDGLERGGFDLFSHRTQFWICTYGKDGCVVFDGNGRSVRIPGYRTISGMSGDGVGTGDAFTGVVCARLSQQKAAGESLSIERMCSIALEANRMGAFVASFSGAIPPIEFLDYLDEMTQA